MLLFSKIILHCSMEIRLKLAQDSYSLVRCRPVVNNTGAPGCGVGK